MLTGPLDDMLQQLALTFEPDPNDPAEAETMNQIHQRYLQKVDELFEKGREQGLEQGARRVILEVCEVLGIELTESRQSHLEALNRGELDELLARLKQNRTWPESSS